MTSRTILFVTGNQGKLLTLQSSMPEGVLVEQTKLDLPEIQSMDIEEISREKARVAFAQLQKPLVVHDAGFYVEALKGFPGPYIKHVGDTIGAEGLLKLMQGETNRAAYFESTLSYVDAKGEIHTFVGDRECGRLAEELDHRYMERSWGEPWKIYIPDGFDVPLAGIPSEVLVEREQAAKFGSPFGKFGEWLRAGSPKSENR